MPAAAWAARSGDPVLFVGRDSVPTATLDTLKRYKDVPVYALGPSAAISDKVLKDVRKVAPDVTRVAGDDPVDNAIAFARYDDGDFGWGIIDPGHGLVIANAGRPMDAAAASPLSASGTWGPLLLTETAEVVPAGLRGYLLDIKPGYVDDPTRAFYNHAWMIGDAKALSVGFQAQVDELLELTPIQEGAGSVGLRQASDQAREEPVSEAERPDRLDPAHEVTVEDIRALAGPSTPHFALQIRNRIRRLIEPLPRGASGAGRRASARSRASRSSPATAATPAGPGPEGYSIARD